MSCSELVWPRRRRQRDRIQEERFKVKSQVPFQHRASQGIQTTLGGRKPDLIGSGRPCCVRKISGGFQILLGRFQLFPDGLAHFGHLAQQFSDVSFNAGRFLSGVFEIFLAFALEIRDSASE